MIKDVDEISAGMVRVRSEKCKVIVGGNAWNGLKDGSLAWNSNNPLSNANVNIGLAAIATIKRIHCKYRASKDVQAQ